MPTTPESAPGNVYAEFENKKNSEKRKQLLGFPRSHAFVIGINHYPDLKAPLQSAVPDAEKLAAVLWDEQGFDHVWLIRNIKGDELRALLEWIGSKGAGAIPPLIAPQEINERTAPGARQLIERNPINRFIRYAGPKQAAGGTDTRALLQKARLSANADPVTRTNRNTATKPSPEISPDDSLVFYYAGHGKAGEFDRGPSGYLLPSDARPGTAVLENDSLVPMDDLLTALQDAGCKHTMLILDCCFAGKFRYAVNTHRAVVQTELRPMYAERFERYKREAAWQVLVSAGPDQTAADWMGDRADETGSDRNPHSPFALALFKALAGEAEVKPAGKGLGDGVLTASELKLYLYDQVEKKTQADPDFAAQYPDLFPMEGHKGGEFIFFDPTNRLNFPEREVKNPYKGLKSYETEDADIFFGRRSSVNAALGFLDNGAVFMAITAPSGVGKSSFAKAGLFPRMKNDRGYATLLQMRPGLLPKTALDGIGFDPEKKQILLIDQFEELYTLCTDEDERQAFETALADHFERIKTPGSKAGIWITIRSDYELKLKSSPLGQALFGAKDGQFLLFRLAPLNLDQLREALTGPALLEAYEFESPQLADRILQEINFSPGALPLMSVAMKNLFKRVEKRRVDNDADVRIFQTADYDNLGGIDGCISAMANAVFGGLPDDAHREMMRKILLRMVQLQGGGFVRRRVYLEPFTDAVTGERTHELDFPNDDQDALCREVLNALEGVNPGSQLEGINLIVRGTDEKSRRYIEPTHDSLINYWDVCLGWIEGFGKDNLNLQRQLWEAVLEWNKQKTATTATSPGGHSFLWDVNPKLPQVLRQVSDAAKPYVLAHRDEILQAALSRLSGGDREKFQVTWEAALQNEEIPALETLVLSGYSDQLLDLFLEKGDHWLNQAETVFVRQSWRERIKGIQELKAERDQARSTALAAIARRIQDNTTGLNLAMAGYRLSPSQESMIAIADLIKKPTIRRIFEGRSDIFHGMALAFSPDGQSILTSSWDNKACLWNLKGELIQSFEGHTHPLTSVAFSPDGQSILTGSEDKTACLWNLQGKMIRSFQGHADRIYTVAFSPDGQSVLTGSQDKTARLWNLQGAMIRSFDGHTDGIFTVAFSPDGQSILAGCLSGTASLWSLEGGLIQTFNNDVGEVYSVAFSPDGQSVLIAGEIPVFNLCSLQGKLIQSFEGHTGIMLSAVFSPDGQSILTGSQDATARLWNLQGETIQVLKRHNATVSSVAFSPNGQSVLTGSYGYTTHIWDLKGDLIQSLQGNNKYVSSVAFSPDGQLILAGTFSKTPFLLNLRGEMVQSFNGHSDLIESVAFAPDGQSVLTGGRDNAACLWNLRGELIQSFKGHTTTIKSVAFAPDGQSILTGSWDMTARLWDLNGEMIKLFKGKITELISTVAFSPDGQAVLTGSSDGTVRLWSLDGKLIHAFEGHNSNIYSVAFSPDGQLILVGSGDMIARLWNLKGELVRSFEGHIQPVNSVVFSPDGQLILTGSYDKTARLWNMKGELVQSFEGHTQSVSAVAFSPDGQLILTGSGDGTINLWHNFYQEWKTGAIWDRLYKLNEDECEQYQITWDY